MFLLDRMLITISFKNSCARIVFFFFIHHHLSRNRKYISTTRSEKKERRRTDGMKYKNQFHFVNALFSLNITKHGWKMTVSHKEAVMNEGKNTQTPWCTELNIWNWIMTDTPSSKWRNSIILIFELLAFFTRFTKSQKKRWADAVSVCEINWIRLIFLFCLFYLLLLFLTFFSSLFFWWEFSRSIEIPCEWNVITMTNLFK